MRGGGRSNENLSNPEGHSESAASRERYLEEWRKDYRRSREKVFVEVSRSTCAGLSEDALWKQVEEIVDPFGGDVDNGGLIEDPLKEQQLHRLH
jgi:hypothetical protein